MTITALGQPIENLPVGSNRASTTTLADGNLVTGGATDPASLVAGYSAAFELAAALALAALVLAAVVLRRRPAVVAEAEEARVAVAA